jgi:nitrate reductase beta subunit
VQENLVCNMQNGPRFDHKLAHACVKEREESSTHQVYTAVYFRIEYVFLIEGRRTSDHLCLAVLGSLVGFQ